MTIELQSVGRDSNKRADYFVYMSDEHEMLRKGIVGHVVAGKLPSVLYKFRPVNGRLQEILATRKLFFSSPISFNDPFDGQLRFDTKNTLAELTEQAKLWAPPQIRVNRTLARQKAKEVLKRPGGWEKLVHESAKREMELNGVCCFSSDWDGILQWAYYADGHAGVALGFEVLKDPLFFILPIKVKYVEKYPRFNFLRDQEKCIEALVTNKAKAWEHEREYRIWKKPPGSWSFRPEALSQITFGAKCPDAVVTKVIKWCSDSGLTHVTYFKARTDERSFSLVRKEI